MTLRRAFFFASPLLATLVGLACTTTSSSSSSSGMTPSDDSGASPGNDAALADAGSSGGSDAGSDATQDAGPTDSGASCTFVNLSGSSSSGGACSTTEEYSCNGSTVEITCDCPANTCKCGAVTTAANCAKGCAATESIRATCGVDTAPPTSDGGGSSSSSSGK
ncbi:MAG: hypothetical protein U0174_07925 [Polyangiaceae bacterium]